MNWRRLRGVWALGRSLGAGASSFLWQFSADDPGIPERRNGISKSISCADIRDQSVLLSAYFRLLDISTCYESGAEGRLTRFN